MKAQQRLDRILEPIAQSIQDEVSALMGVEFRLSTPQNELLNKEDCFYQLPGKQIVALMDIVGDIEGKGCLLVSQKDAIRLGGTLIMLPPTELDEAVRNDEYNEETKDSYGEIANIIAGSYTRVFEEMYPDNCRFIRKEQDVLVPIKVDIEADTPVPNQMYYQTSCGMQIDGVAMGELTMLLPAETFGFEVEKVPAVDNKEDTEGTDQQTPESQDQGGVVEHGVADAIQDEAIQKYGDDAPSRKEQPVQSKPSAKDLEKQKKRIHTIFEECQKRISEEVGTLLGVDVELSDLDNRPVTKEDFFQEETSGKQILAHMDIIDGEADKSFLFVDLKDAIRIGGILIMLPPNEIEVAVSEDEFSADTEDAYGEIANIISGVYTAVFQEQYKESLRLVKTTLEEVAPMKVKIDSEEPIQDKSFYLTSSKLAIDGKEYGKVQMLFPPELFGLEAISLERDSDVVEMEEEVNSSITAKNSITENGLPDRFGATGASTATDILVVGDDDLEIQKILNYIRMTSFTVTSLTLKDNVSSYITDSLKVVILVMKEVNEQSFGAVIKVSSASSSPLIAAGPAWTRSKVIKAVKYGVNDILLTPATEQDIEEKIESNMVQLAA